MKSIKNVPLVVILIVIAIVGYMFWPEEEVVTETPTVVQEQGSVSVQVERSIIGVWRSTLDPKFTREFRADGAVIDAYEGVEPGQGTWELFTNPTGENVPVIPDAVYLKVVGGGIPLYFTVTSVSDTNLELIYIDRGSLSFVRVQ